MSDILFEPDEAEKQVTARKKAAGRLEWITRLMRHWEKHEDYLRRKQWRQILYAVQKDKLLIALENAFEQRIAEIRSYYEMAHKQEEEAGDKRRREELAKIMQRINADTCRLEREELTRRGVLRGRK